MKPLPRSFRAPSFVLLCITFGMALGAGCSAERFGEDVEYRGGPCMRDGDCKSGRRCIDQRCVVDYGDCTTDNDCQNDTYCACPPSVSAERCACIPWGQPPRGRFDDNCKGAAFSPDEFKNPILKCQWPPAGPVPFYKDVLSTPLVIDLDRDGMPEIVFVAGWLGGTHLIAMSGRDCSVKWDKATSINGCTSIAAADLDGDGKAEIVALAPGVTVFDANGEVLASRPEPGSGSCFRDFTPAIANLDGEGPPEIVLGASAFRYIVNPKPQIQILWNKNIIEEGAWGTIPAIADLDGDGKQEVVTGHNVFDGITGADKTPAVLKDLHGGFAAIGDFNADGKPDIVLVSSKTGEQKVSVTDFATGKFIMPPTPAEDGWGGPPTIADFDGDGKPEFATAGTHFYYVYSPDCLKSPKPAKCQGQDEGVLWQSPTQDISSGSTGSSVFDFNGDGIAEVVYRDECWLRVYNGPDGKKLFAAPVSSGTDMEEPVVADVDADGHAEIVVAADTSQNGMCRIGSSSTELGIPHPGGSAGIRVFEDPSDRWMASRPLWNQHSYHITNIDDDLTIPVHETANWLNWNNYRQNVQGVATSTPPQPDPTGKVGLPPDEGDCTRLFRLGGVVCNRGVAPMAPGIPATFYLGDPRRPGARVICTGRTLAVTQSGECQPVRCDWDTPPPGPYDLWMRVDDDGMGHRPQTQCKPGNDLAHMPLAMCGVTPG